MLIGICSGIVSSLIFWILLNIISIPKIQIDDEVQYGRRKNYLRIYNKSFVDVYEVVCYIEYRYNEASSFYRTTNTLPNLKRRIGKYTISLGRNANSSRMGKDVSKTDDFFSKDKGTIVITLTYQNRFGIKRTLKPKSIEYIKEPPDSIA